MATSSIATPTLPNELWIRVLSHVDDCHTLWSACRHVSTSWRSSVSIVFASKWIRKTHIDFCIDDDRYYAFSEPFYIPTDFVRFDDNKTRAIFVLNKDRLDKDDEEELEENMREWRKAMNVYLGTGLEGNSGRRDLPPWFIELPPDVVNDTELPGLEINYEAMEVSFEWKEMYRLLFREEEFVTSRTERYYAGNLEEAEGMKERILRGQMSMEDAIKGVLARVKDVEEAARSDARRRRVREWYREKDGVEWVPAEEEEADTLRILSGRRFMIQFEDSDEEDCESEEEEWEDEEEDYEEDADTASDNE